MRVAVYFNLHKRLFSVKALEGPDKGRVVAHSANLVLDDVTFRVRQGGWQRCINERRKNVHAFMVGDLVEPSVTDDQPVRVTYNPLHGPAFRAREDGREISKASHVWALIDPERRVPIVCAYNPS